MITWDSICASIKTLCQAKRPARLPLRPLRPRPRQRMAPDEGYNPLTNNRESAVGTTAAEEARYGLVVRFSFFLPTLVFFFSDFSKFKLLVFL